MCLKAEFECQQHLLIKRHRSLNLAVLQQILTKLKVLYTAFCCPSEISQREIWPGLSLVPMPETGIFERTMHLIIHYVV